MEDTMRYVEIFSGIVDEIKGGANWSGESETDEIVTNINGFAAIAETITKLCVEIFNAVKSWLGY